MKNDKECSYEDLKKREEQLVLMGGKREIIVKLLCLDPTKLSLDDLNYFCKYMENFNEDEILRITKELNRRLIVLLKSQPERLSEKTSLENN